MLRVGLGALEGREHECFRSTRNRLQTLRDKRQDASGHARSEVVAAWRVRGAPVVHLEPGPLSLRGQVSRAVTHRVRHPQAQAPSSTPFLHMRVLLTPGKGSVMYSEADLKNYA